MLPDSVRVHVLNDPPAWRAPATWRRRGHDGAAHVETTSLRVVETAWFRLFKRECEATAFKFCFQFVLAPPQVDPNIDLQRPKLTLFEGGAGAAAHRGVSRGVRVAQGGDDVAGGGAGDRGGGRGGGGRRHDAPHQRGV